MVKINHNGATIDIHAPPLDLSCSMIEVTGKGEALYDFQMEETVQAIEAYDLAFVDPSKSQIIQKMMLFHNCFSGIPLGIREKDMACLPLPTFSPLFSLGYQPEKGETTMRKIQMHMEIIMSEKGREPKQPILQPYQLALNGMLVRKGEDYPCYIFLGLLIRDDIHKLGFKIFHVGDLLREALYLVLEGP